MNVCRSIDLNLQNTNRMSHGYMMPITPCPPPNQTVPVASYLGTVTKNPIERTGRGELLKLGRGYAPSSLFFQAVHACFAEHHPLALRPEVLMHLIVNEIATTVKLHPESYRHLFSSSAERQRIDVRHDGLRLGDPDSPWDEALQLFKPALEAAVPSTIMTSLLPEFSTHTMETRAASMVSFLDAASPYYDYHVHTKCGIPSIRLLGTAQDYTLLHQAAIKLSEAFKEHLHTYFDHLLPVLEKLAAQAHGAELDTEFWRSIYKFASSSGSETFNGWLSAFVYYVHKTEGYGSQAKGALVPKQAEAFDWQNCERPNSWSGLTGLSHGCVPAQLSSAPFVWHYFGEEFNMTFFGGVLGIDNEDGYVTPALSYAITRATA